MEPNRDLYLGSVDALYEVFGRDDRIKFLSPSERALLIEDPPEYLEGTTSKYERPSTLCYPKSSLAAHLAHFFCLIMETGTCPVWDMPEFAHFDEGYSPQERRESILWVQEQLQGAVELWDHWNFKEKQLLFVRIIKRLRRRGLLDMLMLRHTFCSVDLLPIPRHRLLEACSVLNTQEEGTRSVLTVCGRAVDKHSVRDSSHWWGICKGTEEDKNKHGLKVMNKILDNAIWINIHLLPGQIKTLEIRTAEEYGARFDYEPLRFRGFLEPHQLEGWTNRYKH